MIQIKLLLHLSTIKGDWKYLAPSNGPAVMRDKNMETGNSKLPQLYNIKKDIGESNNLASRYPEKIAELDELLKDITAQQKPKILTLLKFNKHRETKFQTAFSF
jgi:hypothetical protein